MDFVTSHFFMNKPLTNWTPFHSIWGTLQYTGTPTWGKKGSTGQRFILKNMTSYKINILVAILNDFVYCNLQFKWAKNLWCPLMSQKIHYECPDADRIVVVFTHQNLNNSKESFRALVTHVPILHEK